MTDAVLLMAYGSPDSLDQVEAYYTDIRRGNPPASASARGAARALPGDRRRLAALGHRRASARRAVRRARPARHADPGLRRDAPHRPADRDDRRADGGRRGRRDFVAIALAPQRSSNGAGYRRAVDAALDGLGPDAPSYTFVESWHDEPRFIEALAAVTREAIDRLSDPAARAGHVHRPQPAGASGRRRRRLSR